MNPTTPASTNDPIGRAAPDWPEPYRLYLELPGRAADRLRLVLAWCVVAVVVVPPFILAQVTR